MRTSSAVPSNLQSQQGDDRGGVDPADRRQQAPQRNDQRVGDAQDELHQRIALVHRSPLQQEPEREGEDVEIEQGAEDKDEGVLHESYVPWWRPAELSRPVPGGCQRLPDDGVQVRGLEDAQGCRGGAARRGHGGPQPAPAPPSSRSPAARRRERFHASARLQDRGGRPSSTAARSMCSISR